MGKRKGHSTYGEGQREEAFQAWYRSGRPAITKFSSVYRDADSGRRVARDTLARWSRQYEWEDRAAGLDGVAIEAAEEDMIQERAAFMRKQLAFGRTLQRKGAEYLDEHGIKTEYGALRGITEGLALEREVVGLPELLLAITEMNDDDLIEFVREQQAMIAGEDAEWGYEEGIVPDVKVPDTPKQIEAKKKGSNHK